MAAFIQAIGTNLPMYSTNQAQIADFMVKHLNMDAMDEKKLRVLYRATGIQKRYSVLEDFNKNLNGQGFFKHDTSPSAKPRMELYQKHAIHLAHKAVENVIDQVSIPLDSITHLITVSCTGMYAPGLDIELIENLGLSTSTQRTSINFMGCYASFNALKLASQIVTNDSQAKVLIVSVELCSIHFQDKRDDDSLLANAIFGDGAAAVMVGSEPSPRSFRLDNFYNDLALQAKSEMGWFIGDFGFEMKLSSKVPEVIKDGIGELTDKLLSQTQLKRSDISLYAIHPGGKRILEVIEEKLNITKEQNWAARQVLRDYGNMSSPTILFVLKAILDTLTRKDHDKQLLSFAFGPGLTLESAILKTQVHA